MPRPIRFAEISAFIFSPKAATVAAGAVLAAIFGCVGLNIIDKAPDDNSVVQEGALSLPPNFEVDIYFKVPFHKPPEMTIGGGHGDCIVTDRKETHFRIHNQSATSRNIEWKARGEAGGPERWNLPPQPSPATTPEPSPATDPVEKSSPAAQLGQPK